MNRFLGMEALCAMILAGMTMMGACYKSMDGDSAPEAAAAPAAAPTPAAAPSPSTPKATSLKDGDVPAAAANDDGMLHTIVEKDGEVWLPGITIDLKFDDETRTKMLERGETVIVSYIIEAYPEDSVADYDDIGSDGSFNLTVDNREITPDNPHVVIHHTVVDSKRYHALSEKDRKNVQLLINVYSGRKTDDGNILACGIVQGALLEWSGKAYPVSCKPLFKSK